MASHPSGGAKGRPSKLTPEFQAKFVDLVAKGNLPKTACALLRLDYSTYQGWMRAGEQSYNEETVAFREAVLQADAEHEATVLAQWEAINGKMLDGSTKTDWR